MINVFNSGLCAGSSAHVGGNVTPPPPGSGGTSQTGLLHGSPELTKKVKTSISAMQADKGKLYTFCFNTITVLKLHG